MADAGAVEQPPAGTTPSTTAVPTSPEAAADPAAPAAGDGAAGEAEVTEKTQRRSYIETVRPVNDLKDFFVCLGILIGFTAICGIGILVLYFAVIQGENKILNKNSTSGDGSSY